METFENTELLEPLSLYRDRLKDSFHTNSEEFFEEMVKKGNVNVEENQDICKKYYQEQKTIAEFNKKKSSKNTLRVFSIIGIIAFTILAVVFIILGVKAALGLAIAIPVAIGGFLLTGLMIFFVVILSKKIKNLKAIIDEHQQKANALLAKAYDSMAGLNNQYEWNMAAGLFTKTTPLIKLDPVFDPEKYGYLHEKYGYSDYKGKDMSTVYVQSGSILGNPFVFEKNYCQNMRDHIYEGSMVITYTVRVSDGKGGSRLETRTQTLIAHYTAPEPYYYLDTWLIFGSDAAPKLSFSRYPTDINSMNDKQIAKYVKNFDAKLDKKVEKDLKDGNLSSFTRMHNEEFEALFNALDRDNETEFRLLFTPLGQKNMISLLKSKDVAFGDDFIFKKKKALNYIKSRHMQLSDSLDRNPDSFVHFDYKVAKENFLNYTDKYLKDVFFDLAPLISIPLYQQHKSIDYIYEKGFNRNTTNAEVESAANSFNINLFKHPKTRSTGVILKSEFNSTYENVDQCTINAHSFEGIDRVAYVPVRGNDGLIHNVPVKWIEYLPISKTTPFVVSDTKGNKSEYQNNMSQGKFDNIINKFGNSSAILFKKRLMSFIPKN